MNTARATVALLSSIQLSECPAPLGLAINIREAVNGFVDASDFGDGLGEETECEVVGMERRSPVLDASILIRAVSVSGFGVFLNPTPMMSPSSSPKPRTPRRRSTWPRSS